MRIEDPALPQLATALDERAMTALFGAGLADGGGRTVAACRIDRVKYRPGRNCHVSYRLTLRGGQGGDVEQAVSTRWCSRADDAARRHAEALRLPSRASAAGPAWWHRPEHRMVAAWLPNDPRLPALRTLLDGECLRARWLPEVAAALEPGARVVDHSTALVQWVPEHRACARVTLRIAPGRGDGGIGEHVLYAKTDAEGQGMLAHGAMQALSANPRLRLPRPVAWQPAAGLHWQRAVAGRPLSEEGSVLPLGRAAQVGTLLAHLHATPVRLPATRRVTADALRRRRRRSAQVIADALPALRAEVAALEAALDRADDPLAAEAPATLHGDLHRGNLLLDDEADALAPIDLDSVCTGPAALELGGWIAEALFLGWLDGQPPRRVLPQCLAMLDAYARASGRRTPDARALAWAAAQQLLDERAYRCVANLKPGRLALVPTLLRAAEALARTGRLDAAGTVA